MSFLSTITARRKEVKNLRIYVLRMNEFVSIEEVTEAYLDCRRHKGRSQGAVEYQLDYELNNLQLWRDLNAGTYAISPSRAFCVTRPKLREVFCASFRDRIVHHLLVNKFLPLIEDTLTDAAFACRRGKGVEYGVRKAAEAMCEVSDGYTKEAWVLRCDMEAFFMSIPRHRLWDELRMLIVARYKGGDIMPWLKLWKQVILNRPEQHCVKVGDLSLWDKLPENKSLFTSGGKGLPIGNLPSQILANFYLAGFDRWAQRIVGVGRYGRYVDDFFAVSEDKAVLLGFMERARKHLSDLGLTLHPKKIYLQPVRHGMEWTGAVIKPYGIVPSRRLKRFVMETVDEWNEDEGRVDDEAYVRRMNSYMGFLVHRKSYSLRWRVWQRIKRKARLCCVDMRKLKFKI